jgi:hypothetical protein
VFGLTRRPATRHNVRNNRAFLRLEDLEGRANPSGSTLPSTDAPAGHESRLPVAGDSQPPINTNQPPDIRITDVRPVGNGVYLVSGTVSDEHPGGLTVSFGGVPSAVGKSTVTNDDGSFSILITFQTNGTDTGVLTASVTDNGGLSDEDFCYVFPN